MNEHLPQWFRFSGEYRVRLEGLDGIGFRPDNRDAYALGRLRLNVTLKPASWLKFQLQGQDAQIAGANAPKPDAPPFEDTMDLRMAYAEIGDPENQTFGLRAGRQELAFGEQRLAGHVSWLNTARAFDAIRATYRRDGVRVDAFAASVVNVREGESNKRAAGNNFHGMYAVLNKLVPKASVEPFVFWRLAPRLRTEAGVSGSLDFKTAGLRLAGKLPAGFDYGMEAAVEKGSLASDDVSAWASHWVLGYTMAKTRTTPRLIAEYNFASGDKNPADGIKGTFDQLYPTPHDKYGLSDQVSWKNIHHVRAGVELKPSPKVSVTANYHSSWLANVNDGLYNAGGAVIARAPAGSAGKHVGQELDAQAVFAVSGQVQLAGGYAHIFPGTFLMKATPGKAYKFPYVMITYFF